MGTGTSAIPCLLKGFTNRAADVRSEAAHCITEWDAKFPEEQKQAIPYVIKLLEDSDEQVRMSATNDLLELDPHAAASLGIKPDRNPPSPGGLPRNR